MTNKNGPHGKEREKKEKRGERRLYILERTSHTPLPNPHLSCQFVPKQIEREGKGKKAPRKGPPLAAVESVIGPADLAV